MISSTDPAFARRAHTPEVVGSSPASATISKALLSSDSKASFYAQNLMCFHPKYFHQPSCTKPCLATLGKFPGRHRVGELEEVKIESTSRRGCSLCDVL